MDRDDFIIFVYCLVSAFYETVVRDHDFENEAHCQS